VRPEPKTVTVHSLGLRAESPDRLSVDVTTSTGFYVRSLAHDVGCALGCGGYLHHLHRVAIGPYTAADALDQRSLEDAQSADEIIGGNHWIPLDRAILPFPEIDLNSSAAERFVHGQEIVVFKPGIEGLETNGKMVVRGPGERLLGIGAVRAILARGRTLNIAPVMVFDTNSASTSGPT
jgi:tRNA pseudouridine55 synthase